MRTEVLAWRAALSARDAINNTPRTRSLASTFILSLALTFTHFQAQNPLVLVICDISLPTLILNQVSEQQWSLEMARFLTPSKIGLLILIEVYTEGDVSISSTIPILSFVASNLLPASLPKSQNRLPGETSDPKNPQFMITIQSYCSFLSAHPSAKFPGRTLWDIFLEKLWHIDSLDAVHEFFDSRSTLLAKTREETQKDTAAGIAVPDENVILLSRTSPFGAFVRKSQLEFTRLKFHDAVDLWKSFIAYRQPTFPCWQKRIPSSRPWSFDAVLDEGDEMWQSETTETLASVLYGIAMNEGDGKEAKFASTDEAEKLLEFQVGQMQSKS